MEPHLEVKMVDEIDLKRIERNLFRDYCQDGLADTVVCGVLLLIGLLVPSG